MTHARKVLGATGLEISPIVIGSGGWGVTSPIHELSATLDQVVATVHAIFEGPINCLDTSNIYGDGESERRIGIAIREYGGLPDGFLLQTKLDRDPATNDFSPDRMWRSLDESLSRLGVDRVPLLFLHDPENTTFDAGMRATDTLLEMRERGFTSHVGVSGGPAPVLQRFVDTGLFDALMTHNRYSLLDQRAESLILSARSHGMGVFNAAVYGGGILASSPRTMTTYRYEPASPGVLTAVDAMLEACRRHDIPIAAAALQLSLQNPAIHSTVVGVVTPQQLTETLRLARLPLSPDVLDELRALRPRELRQPE